MHATTLPEASSAFAARREFLRRAGAAAAGLGPLSVLPAVAAGSDRVLVSRPSLGAIPPIPLVSMSGQARRLDVALSAEVPLLLNFVFTSCSSSCSVQTALLVQVQRALQERGRPVQIASISIDPDNDTPEQLRRFAGGFGITSGWQFYTGGFDDLMRVQKLFDVYRGSKAAHPPVLFVRRATAAPWVRVEGFPGESRLVALIDALPAAA